MSGRLRPAAATVRARAGDESGVVAILVAMMLVLILAAAAVAIDVGSFYQAQRQAQSAADAAALAASQDLPDLTSQAVAAATTYVQTNFPTATVTATPASDSNGTLTKIKVTVSASTPSFFGSFFGLTSERVSASATAGADINQVKAAIFARAVSGCGSGIDFSNSNSINVTGGVVSDGSITLSTNPHSVLGAGYFGDAPGCTAPPPGPPFTYGPVAAPPRPYPITYTNAPNCPAAGQSIQSGGLTITTYGGTEPETLSSIAANTVYCNPNGAIVLDSSNNGCSAPNVQFYAAQIDVAKNHCTMSAPSLSDGSYNWLMWATGADTSTYDAITIGANNSAVLSGTLYAPAQGATIVYSGNSGGTGLIEGDNVVINANSFTITGDGPVIGSTGDSLEQ